MADINVAATLSSGINIAATLSGNSITTSSIVSTSLGGLTDVTISSPTDNQVLSYDSATSTWVNSSELNYVASDTKFSFNGTSETTYIIFNSTTGKLELYVSGVKQAEWG